MTISLQCVLMAFLLFGVSICTSQSSGSGSGSGNTDATDVCENVTCEGGECIDVDGVAVCDCEIGTATYSDQYKCEACAVGYWGQNCATSCSVYCGGEGHFSSCEAVTGTCMCNICWSGSNCSVETDGSNGFECVLSYIESVEKDLEDYGGHVPVAADTAWLGLARELVDDSGTVVQDDSSTLTIVDRSDVGAKALLRFSFILRDGPGNTDYDNAVGSIKDKVKTGEIRGTLIIDESEGDSGTVTLNA